MIKKTMLLAMAMGAVAAFVLPTVASAQLLTDPVGTALAKGAKVTAISTNLETVTPLGTLTCTKVTIHGEVLENKATKSRIGNTTTTVEGCNTLITNQKVGIITFEGKEAASVTGATFVADLSETLSCHYEAGSIPAHYITHTDTLTVTGTNQFTGTPLNPCGTGTMTGHFTIVTSDGTTPVIIH